MLIVINIVINISIIYLKFKYLNTLKITTTSIAENKILLTTSKMNVIQNRTLTIYNRTF